MYFSTYESEADIAAVLSSFKERRKRDSKAFKGRPAQIHNTPALERLILKAVCANAALPQEQRLTRKILQTSLWEETRAQGLHILRKAGFKTFFFSTLRAHGWTKKYTY